MASYLLGPAIGRNNASRLGAAGNPQKKGGLGGRPKFFSVFQSDVDDRNDPVVAVDDDDLIANDEVHVPAPSTVSLRVQHPAYQKSGSRTRETSDSS